METLNITWTDHRGKVWDLTSGAQGVILDTGQSGLGWAELVHTFGRGDMIHQAATVGRGVHDLRVLVGHDLQGTQFYTLYHEWWSEANSPYHLGTLTVTRPDGTSRFRRLRLHETPDTTFLYDPGMGLDPQPELWSITGDTGWWYGPEQLVTVTAADFSGGTGTPFYGPGGAGWPLYISSGSMATDAALSNTGQGPMWPTWTLVGPLSSPSFGVASPGHPLLSYYGDVAAGEVVTVTTDPAQRSVVEATTGENRYSLVFGEYAPVPAGERVPLSITAEGMTEQSAIHVSGHTAHATAF